MTKSRISSAELTRVLRQRRGAWRISSLEKSLLGAPLVGAVAIAGHIISLPTPLEVVVATAAGTAMIVLVVGWRWRWRELSRRFIESVQLSDAAPDALLVMHDDGTIILANARVEDMFGYGPEELTGRSVKELVPETVQDGCRGVPRLHAMNSAQTLLARRRDGTTIPVAIGFSSTELDGKHIVLCAVRDATDSQRAHDALLKANADLTREHAALEERALAMRRLEQASEFLQYSIDEEEVHRLISQWGSTLAPGTSGALLLYNASRTEVAGVAHWGRSAGNAIKPLQRIDPQSCWALRRGRPHYSDPGRVADRCAHHEGTSQSALCVPLLGQGESLGVLAVEGVAGMMSDAREQSLCALADRAAAALVNLRLREALRVQTVRDPLTGLYNRRYFDEAIEREVGRAARGNSELAMLMIDFDHFKKLNDTFGHQAGDAALRAVGGLLLRELRATDIVGRLGGEELAVMLPDTDRASARKVAEQLRQRVRDLPLVHGQVTLPPLTISVGVAMAPGDAADAASLIARADQALYRAKRAGRNRVVEFDSGTEADVPVSRHA